MHIREVHLKGYRNFRDARILLSRKSLIIGCNEVGKTNLLYALRLLLDRTIPEAALEPRDSDFHAYHDTCEFSITVTFCEVTEDCVLAKLGHHVGSANEFCLSYRATRDGSGRKEYTLFAGTSRDSLIEIPGRFYLRVLNLKFVGSNRDLASFIRSERRNLLQDARGSRTDEEVAGDDRLLTEIKESLDTVSAKASSLSYVDRATNRLNVELRKLSVQNSQLEVRLNAGESDPAEFIDNLQLVTSYQDRALAIGGDERNNQVHLALWAARNGNRSQDDGSTSQPLEVSLVAIEEPEAHLHPHQQRRLASYLANYFVGQVIMTTHSPQIVCEYPPRSLIRLYPGDGSVAADGGSSRLVGETFVEFGHRLDVLPAEAFFANVILLVEGRSDELFYRALARSVPDFDLDRLNASILAADGIGFIPYINLFSALRIPCVIRTDNDILKIPNRDEYRFAGLQRGIQAYQNMVSGKLVELHSELELSIEEGRSLLSGFPDPVDIPRANRSAAERIATHLGQVGVFLSDVDLEGDLSRSEIAPLLQEFHKTHETDELVQRMRQRKATFMFHFLQNHAKHLSCLACGSLASPLLRCKQIVESYYGNCAYA